MSVGIARNDSLNVKGGERLQPLYIFAFRVQEVSPSSPLSCSTRQKIGIRSGKRNSNIQHPVSTSSTTESAAEVNCSELNLPDPEQTRHVSIEK